MAFIPISHCFQVVVKQSLGGSSFPVNVYHLDATSFYPLTQSLADQIADVFEDAYENSALQGLLSTAWQINEIQVTDLTSSSSPQFNGAFDAIVGTDVTDPLPAQTCGMIEWGTALRGRSYRGKTFISGFCEDGSGGGPTATVVTRLGDFATDLRTNLAALPAPLVIASRFSGTHLAPPDSRGRVRLVPTPRVAGVMTPVTFHAAETQWKTQRRRAFPG